MKLRSAPAFAGLLLLGTLAGLALLEAGFRVAASLEHRGLLTAELQLPPDPARGRPARLAQMIRRSANAHVIYELRPNLYVHHEAGMVTTNSRGFRSPDYPEEPPPNTLRIVGLGDSIMFGFGVDDEGTYLARLEARLNRGDPARRAQIVNTAVPGYNTVMEVETLRVKGLAYRPDLVILEFVGNDLDLPNFIREPPRLWALDRSFCLQFVKTRLDRFRGRRRPSEVDETGLIGAPAEGAGEHFLGDPGRVPPEYAQMVGWEACERALRELAALAEQRRFRVVFMGWDSIPEERKARRLARSLGFSVLNLYPPLARHLRQLGFESYLSSPLARSPRDPHPSGEGHEYLSRLLEEFVTENGLLAPRPAPSP